MALPTTPASGYTTQLKSNSSADRRRPFRYANPTSTARSVSVCWPNLDSSYIKSAVVHVEDADGLITDDYVTYDDSETAVDCVLTVPGDGYLVVTGIRPDVYRQPSPLFTLNDTDITDPGDPAGSSKHPASTALLTQADGLIQSPPAIPSGDYTPAVDQTEDPLTTEQSLLLSKAAFIASTVQDSTTGGVKDSYSTGGWDGTRGFGYSTGNSIVMSTANTFDHPQNELFGGLTQRTKAMLMWELSRTMDNGSLGVWTSDFYSGSVGLINAHMLPSHAIIDTYDTFNTADKAEILNAVKIIGHANAIFSLESAANQSFHFLANTAAFIKTWRFIRDGESDETKYDGLMQSMINAMLLLTDNQLGDLATGIAFGENYGADNSYTGLQKSNIADAIHALTDITELATERAYLLSVYDSMLRYADSKTGVDAEGNAWISTGASSRLNQVVQQYGPGTSMMFLSRYPQRYFDYTREDGTVSVGEYQTNVAYHNQLVRNVKYIPASGEILAVQPIESTLNTPGVGGNEFSGWVRTAKYFAGYAGQVIWRRDSVSRVNVAGGVSTDDEDGTRIGQAGEPCGPFSADVERNGVSYETELATTTGGVLAGQGALESLSINGKLVVHTRNVSPLTVHGVYAVGDDPDDTGTDRYFTVDPHSASHSLNAEKTVLTTTFKLYLIDATFTRVLDMSDSTKVTNTLTVPDEAVLDDYELFEVVPVVQVEGTPRLAVPEGFTRDQGAVFGMPDDELSLGRLIAPVARDQTLEYDLEEYAVPDNILLTELKALWPMTEAAGNLIDSVGGLALLAAAPPGGVNHRLFDTTTTPPVPLNLEYAAGYEVWTNDPLKVPEASFTDALRFGTTRDLTWAGWFMIPSGASLFERVFEILGSDGSTGISVLLGNISETDIYLRVNGTNLPGNTNPNISYPEDEFFHFGLVYNRGVGFELWLNGTKTDTLAWTGTLSEISGRGLSIASEYGGTGEINDVGFSQFGVWHRALDATDFGVLAGSGDGIAFSGFGPIETGGNRSRDRNRER